MGGPKTAIFSQVVHFYPDAVGHITIGGNRLSAAGLEACTAEWIDSPQTFYFDSTTCIA